MASTMNEGMSAQYTVISWIFKKFRAVLNSWISWRWGYICVWMMVILPKDMAGWVANLPTWKLATALQNCCCSISLISLTPDGLFQRWQTCEWALRARRVWISTIANRWRRISSCSSGTSQIMSGTWQYCSKRIAASGLSYWNMLTYPWFRGTVNNCTSLHYPCPRWVRMGLQLALVRLYIPYW